MEDVQLAVTFCGSVEWTPTEVPVKDQHVTYVSAPGQTSQGPLIMMDDSQKLTLHSDRTKRWSKLLVPSESKEQTQCRETSSDGRQDLYKGVPWYHVFFFFFFFFFCIQTYKVCRGYVHISKTTGCYRNFKFCTL